MATFPEDFSCVRDVQFRSNFDPPVCSYSNRAINVVSHGKREGQEKGQNELPPITTTRH